MLILSNNRLEYKFKSNDFKPLVLKEELLIILLTILIK